MASNIPEWMRNLIDRVATGGGGSTGLGNYTRPPSFAPTAQTLTQQSRSQNAYAQRMTGLAQTYRPQQAYSARMNALARYYTNKEMVNRYTYQQKYWTPMDWARYYANQRGWRAYGQRMTAMALNYPMQETRPSPVNFAGGGGGGYGGGYGGGAGMNQLPEWYLAVMNWRI